MINIDEKARILLEKLLENNNSLSQESLQLEFSVSKRTVYNLVNKTNDFLFIYGIDPIKNKRGSGYYLDSEQKERIQSILSKELVRTSLKQDDRVYYLICWLLYNQETVHVETISEQLSISRNSVFSDLKKVKTEIMQYNLELVNQPKMGYVINGKLSNYHAIFLYYVSKLLLKVTVQDLHFLNCLEVELFYGRLLRISKKLGNEYKNDNYLLCLACLLSITHHVKEYFDFSLLEIKELGKTNELRLIDEEFQDFNVHERLYLAIYLLGSNSNNSVKNLKEDRGNDKDIELYELSALLTDKFEKISRIRIKDKDDLINSLFLHFKLSFYYSQISIQIPNPFIDDVRKNYHNLYQIVKDLCLSLKDLFPFPLNENEIVYITIHFGGHIHGETNHFERKLKVLIVCPSGISTSVLLKSEIENHFPNIDVLHSLSIEDLKKNPEEVDFIISTIDIDVGIPYIKVHTILSKEDRSRIASLVHLNSNSLFLNYDGIRGLLDIVNAYVPEEQQNLLREEIYQYLQRGNSLYRVDEEKEYRLFDLLSEKRIVILNKDIDWIKGLNIASKPLIREGAIKPTYIDSMIQLVEDYGPYFILKNGVAIAHGKVDQGANRLGLSLLVNRKGVDFEGTKVYLLFVMSSPDQHKHLSMLRDIMELSNNNGFINDLLKGNDTALLIEEIRDYFVKN